jgi:hypothetical protein
VLNARPLLTVACAAAALLLSACGDDGAVDPARVAAGSATAPSAPAPAPEPEPEQVDLSGSVSYLSNVGFTGGSGRDLSYKAPRDGSPCPPEKGYDDIVPGAAVTVSSGTDQTLATVALGTAGSATLTRSSPAERDARAALIDAIYGLRIAKTWNQLEQAQLYETQAKQRLYDLRHPGKWAFEGAQFVAVWCRLEFTVPDLPELNSYVVRVADRTPTVVSGADLESDPDALDLYLD